MILLFWFTYNSLIPYETWAYAVEHNSKILAGIEARNTQRYPSTAFSFCSHDKPTIERIFIALTK